MKALRLSFAGALLALVVGCRAEESPQNSSGSHWVRCNADTDCAPYDPEATCDAEEYCVDAMGARLEEPGSEVEGQGGQGGMPAGGGGTSGGASGGSSSGPTNGGGGSAGTGGALATGGGAAGQGADGAAGGGAGGEVPSPSECPAPPSALGNPNVFEGDYLVTGQSSIDAALLFTEITGSLQFGQRATGDLDEVVLPGLERLGGGLEAEQSLLSRLVLPRLETVGGDLRLNSNSTLAEVELVSLTNVGGQLVVTGNPSLTNLSLPALSQVSGALEFDAALPTCLVQPLYDSLESATEFTGNGACTCELVCERRTATCPAP